MVDLGFTELTTGAATEKLTRKLGMVRVERYIFAEIL